MTRFLVLLLPLLASAFQLPAASTRLVAAPIARPPAPQFLVKMQEGEEAPAEAAPAEEAAAEEAPAEAPAESVLIATDGPDPIKTVGIFFVLAALLIAGRGGIEGSGIAKEAAGMLGQ